MGLCVAEHVFTVVAEHLEDRTEAEHYFAIQECVWWQIASFPICRKLRLEEDYILQWLLDSLYILKSVTVCGICEGVWNLWQILQERYGRIVWLVMCQLLGQHLAISQSANNTLSKFCKKTSLTVHHRPSPLDIPPTWNGANPEQQQAGYLKAVEVWNLTTRLPLRQRGVAVLVQASGDLKLELEELTAENGAEIILQLLCKEHGWTLQRSLPQRCEAALFSTAGMRQEEKVYCLSHRGR
eukprot:5448067-Amphidinium_carterae.2